MALARLAPWPVGGTVGVDALDPDTPVHRLAVPAAWIWFHPVRGFSGFHNIPLFPRR